MRRAPRFGGEPAALVEARADAQRLAPGVEPVDLVAFDASDLEPEAVRAHVDDGERGGSECGRRHGGVERSRIRPAFAGDRRQPRTVAFPRARRFPATLADRVARPRLPSPMPIDYLQKILTAKVYDVAIESPLELAPTLSRRLGNRVLLKREDQQPVFSFKLRGAYNKMAHLSPAARARGVIAASAGNHAQGVALAAQKLGCKATIVMPVTTPHIKIAAVEARGAKVVLHGDSYSDAYRARARAAEDLARDVRASLRRSRRHRRAGHDRHGDPAPVAGADRRDLRRDRRRRARSAASRRT